MITENLHYKIQMPEMLIPRFTIDEDIILMNLNLVIPRTNIQLGKKMSTMKLINNMETYP